MSVAAPIIAKDLSARMPSSLRTSVVVLEANASANWFDPLVAVSA